MTNWFNLRDHLKWKLYQKCKFLDDGFVVGNVTNAWASWRRYRQTVTLRVGWSFWTTVLNIATVSETI